MKQETPEHDWYLEMCDKRRDEEIETIMAKFLKGATARTREAFRSKMLAIVRQARKDSRYLSRALRVDEYRAQEAAAKREKERVTPPATDGRI